MDNYQSKSNLYIMMHISLSIHTLRDSLKKKP